VHDAKTEAVLEIIDELEGKPVLIGYEFHHDRDRLLAVLPNGTPWLGGDGVPMKRQREIIHAWNRGELPVLLGQIHSIAYGLNLQESGSTIIMPSLVWDLEDYEQLIKRVWRQGQKAKRVIVHRIIAHNTVDDVVLDALADKGDRQRALFKAVKRYAQRRYLETHQLNLNLTGAL
jgi:SNF2 family DNA or RNA helicase